MKDLIVYTKNGCPQCQMTKNFLDKRNVEYSVKNVEEDSSAMDYVRNDLGMSSMPIVESKEQGILFAGFRIDALIDMVGE